MFRAYPTGFQLDFSNGLTASVAFGSLNYCANKALPHSQIMEKDGAECETAELAVWETKNQRDRNYIIKECGWNTPEEIAACLTVISSFKPHIQSHDELQKTIKRITNI